MQALFVPARRICVLLSVAAVVAGCAVRVTGADSGADFAAEDQYRSAYQQGVTGFLTDAQAFAATATSPGVCNKGGSKQGCYDADVAVVADLKDLTSRLSGLSVPPRFANADQMLRAAVAKDIQGLEMRNAAIANNDNALWAAHKPLLDDAVADLHAAYLAFPDDNRPVPAL